MNENSTYGTNLFDSNASARVRSGNTGGLGDPSSPDKRGRDDDGLDLGFRTRVGGHLLRAFAEERGQLANLTGKQRGELRDFCDVRTKFVVMCGLGPKALKPRVPGPKKPSPAQPGTGLGGLEGWAFVSESPSQALKPGLF